MRILLLWALLVLGALAFPALAHGEPPFEDPMFRRCLGWMLDGKRGGLIENICREEFDLPPPSLFLCARKVRMGFLSLADREGCAILFEDEAKRARSGYIK